MYFKSSLAEINDRLGAILEERGLEMYLEGGPSYFETLLFFQRRERNGLLWRSPLTFYFISPDRTSLKEATFDNGTIKLGTGRSEVHSVGTNGWVHYQGGWSDAFHDIGSGQKFETWDQAFEHAADVLLEDPLVPEGEDFPMVLEDCFMFRFWAELKSLCHHWGIDKVDAGRIDIYSEFFEFEYLGRRLRLAFDTDDGVTITRDDAEVDLVNLHGDISLEDSITSQLQAIHDDLSPVTL